MKYFVSGLLVLCLIFNFAAPPAHADVMTVSALAAGLVAVAAGAGTFFSSSYQSVAALQNWATNKINNYLGGRSIPEVFGSEYIRNIAGKLVIPANIYSALKGLISDEIEETGATPGGDPVNMAGTFYGRQVNIVEAGNPIPLVSPMIYDFNSQPLLRGLSVTYNSSSRVITAYINGESISTHTVTFTNDPTAWFLFRRAANPYPQVALGMVCVNPDGQYWGASGVLGEYDEAVTIKMDTAFNPPNVDVGYQWEGALDGSAPDTLPQLIDTIFDMGASDTLGVQTEVTEETPYPPQPTTYPIDDIIGGMEQIDEDIVDAGVTVGQAVGGLQDAVHSQTGEITDSIEGTTDAVESLEGTLTEALDVPTTAEASAYKWDLKQLFPFCIPFDIANMYQAFDGTPTAPNIQIPIAIPSFGFSYTMQLDFSPFNGVAAILRQVELIAFGLALAWGTSKVIRW